MAEAIFKANSDLFMDDHWRFIEETPRHALHAPSADVDGAGNDKAILGWSAAAFNFLAIAMPLPHLHDALRPTSLTASEWALAFVASFACSFWMEARKLPGNLTIQN